MTSFGKNYGFYLFSGIFLVIIFLLSLKNPTTNSDIFFHIASGKIILTHGITHVDYFSYVTKGREWFPYEWLFQITVYFIHKYFGMLGIEYFISGAFILFISGVIAIQRYVFRLPTLLTLCLSFFLSGYVYTDLTPRPGTVALGLLTWNLFFLLLYILRKKNFLWITLILTLIWANLHGSIFLDVFLFCAYALLTFLLFLKTKQKEYLHQTKQLAIYSVITFLITIAPPMWTAQYRLLLLFAKHNAVFSGYINEWRPIWERSLRIEITFLLISGITLLVTAFLFFKRKHIATLLYILPLLVLVSMGFSASRNIYISTTACIFIIALVCSVTYSHLKRILQYSIIVLILLASLLQQSVFRFHVRAPMQYYPEQAAAFIKTHDFQGNMYNPLDVGGYLMYALYPEKKVFIDGRLDLYACCELNDEYHTFPAITESTSPEFISQAVQNFFNKYHFSYALVSNDEDTQFVYALLTNPSWRLIYWDDREDIFVKNDGKNTKLINQLGAPSVYLPNPISNPYVPSFEPYKPHMRDQALEEYQKMARVTDSEITELSIAKIAIEKQDISLALGAIRKIKNINPADATPYLMAGQIYITAKNYQAAISEYQGAIKISSHASFPYLQLGQLYAVTGDTYDAQQILQQGEQFAKTDTERATFENLLQKIQLGQ